MTIKLIVDPKVSTAMKVEFPNSNVDKMLDKYLTALENCIINALQHGQTNQQRLFKLFSIPTSTLLHSGGRIGPNKVWLHSWLSDNGLNLIETVNKGSNVNGKYSECKLTSLVTLENTLPIPSADEMGGMTDAEIDIALAGPQDAGMDIVNRMYPDILTFSTPEEITAAYDLAEVDVISLQSYIVWVTTEATKYTAAKKEAALRQAKMILAVAQDMEGFFPQRMKPSAFGRTYYEGISVQSVNKDLRRAMLGECWMYDIRSSVIAWKMGFADVYLASMGATGSLRTTFSATLCYLEDKRDFIATVKHYTFKDDSNSNSDFQKKLIKQALQAISFGARKSTHGWIDGSGQFHNPAMVDILRNATERERFFNCPTIRAFIHEQKLLDTFIFESVKQTHPNVLDLPYLKAASGRVSKTKVLAYLYQHNETDVMAIVKNLLSDSGHKILASIHDAVIVRNRLGAERKHEIEFQMQEQSGNPYWRLASEKLIAFQPRLKDVQKEEQEHRQRIREEEARAKEFK